MITTERWRPIPGWEHSYEASDLGRIRSVDRVVTRSDGRTTRLPGVLLRPAPDRHGYLAVALCSPARTRTTAVHSLVLTAFVGPRPDGMDGCHNDGDPLNNQLANLRWDTRAANVRDCIRHGRHVESARTHCIRGHALAGPNLVTIQRADGRRFRNCRSCRHAHAILRCVTTPPSDRAQWLQAEADRRYAELQAVPA